MYVKKRKVSVARIYVATYAIVLRVQMLHVLGPSFSRLYNALTGDYRFRPPLVRSYNTLGYQTYIYKFHFGRFLQANVQMRFCLGKYSRFHQ